MKSKENIVGFLRRYRDNRGAMASLRYLLKPGAKMRGWQIIGKINGIGDRTVETIAGLYSFHPEEKIDSKYNFGDACRSLAISRKKDNDSNKDENTVNQSPFDCRFRRLLSCDTREELCTQLPDIVRGLKTAEIPVNYESLYDDIKYWSEKVRERWAIHYWSDRKEEEDVFD